jgi:hypothetical protein
LRAFSFADTIPEPDANRVPDANADVQPDAVAVADANGDPDPDAVSKSDGVAITISDADAEPDADREHDVVSNLIAVAFSFTELHGITLGRVLVRSVPVWPGLF